MLQGFSYMRLNESHPDNIERLSDDIIKDDLNEPSGISRVITGVTNNSESKVDRVIHFSDTGTADISAGKSFLKCLLIVGTTLAGAGILAAGGFYRSAGRHNTSHRSEIMPLSYLPEVPSSVNSIYSDVGGETSATAGYALRPDVDSTATPETSFSPYSYYEKIYGDRATQNQTRQQASASTTDISGNHDRMRSVLYNTLMSDYDNSQPLGPIFHAQISDFCYSELIKPAIEQAYTGDVNLRCTLLRNLSNIIDDFTVDEILFVDDHDLLKALTKNEYMEELIIKRKVTTLIMAAESIMENKNFDEFYIDAMKNYKQYSASEIENKESVIWDYLSDNECLDDYEDSNEDSNEDSEG